MPWLERHEGCGGDPYCMGPDGPYWVFLGNAVNRLVWMDVLAAALIALIPAGVLYAYWRGNGLRPRHALAAGAFAAAWIPAFLVVWTLGPLSAVQY